MAEEFDLFGNPVIDRRGKAGRPSYVPNERDSNKIKLLLALGWTNERIAHAISLSVPTLRKHYFQLLKVRDYQRDMLDAARLAKLWDLFMSGNVGASKEFGRLLEKSDAMQADRAFRGDDSSPEPRPERLGKKELAQIAAEEAEKSDDWGDDLQFRGRPN